MGGVLSEGVQDVGFVVVREAGVGRGDGGEAHVAGGLSGRHGRRVEQYRFGGGWWGWVVVVGCFDVEGRHGWYGLGVYMVGL